MRRALLLCYGVLLIPITLHSMDNEQAKPSIISGFDKVSLHLHNSSENLTLKMQFSEGVIFYRGNPCIPNNRTIKNGSYTINTQKNRSIRHMGGNGLSYYNCYVHLRDNNLAFTIKHSDSSATSSIEFPLESIPPVSEPSKNWYNGRSTLIMRKLAQDTVGCKLFYNHYFTIDNYTKSPAILESGDLE
jgi:hypothetical protein